MPTNTIKTRQTSDGRSTMNSEKRGIVDTVDEPTKKKKKINSNLPANNGVNNKIFVDGNSGTSSSSSDEEKNDKNDNNKLIAEQKETRNEGDIDDDDDQDVNDTGKKRKKYVLSYLSVNRKSKINLYVHNDLFKKIKILGNDHLKDDGQIMQEVFKRIQYDPKVDNLNLLTQECRFLIKQTMCSRRGYV